MTATDMGGARTDRPDRFEQPGHRGIAEHQVEKPHPDDQERHIGSAGSIRDPRRHHDDLVAILLHLQEAVAVANGEFDALQFIDPGTGIVTEQGTGPEFELIESGKVLVRRPVEIGAQDPDIDRDSLRYGEGPINAWRRTDVALDIADMQRQVAADQPADFVTVVDPTQRTDRAPYE